MHQQAMSVWNVMLTLVVAFLLAGSSRAQGCTYLLKMFDEGGDGWEGSYLSVQINGGPPSQYTCTTDYAEVELPVDIGDAVQLLYMAGSSAESEIGYAIELADQEPWNSVKFASTWGPTAGYYFVVDCLPLNPMLSDCLGAPEHIWSTTPGITYPYNANVYRTGKVIDLDAATQGCLTDGEVHGIWIMLRSEFPFNYIPQGALDLTIDPGLLGSGNYDFAIWGPFDNGGGLWDACPDLGEPIRCSRSTLTGMTGLSSAALDEFENETGDGWLAPIWMGIEAYYMLYVTDAVPSLGFGFTFDAFTLSTNAMALPLGRQALTVVPNPANAQAAVFLPSGHTKASQLVVMDAMGRVVQRVNVPSNGPLQRIPIDIEGLAPAIYSVYLVNADGSALAQGRFVRE